MARTGVTPEFRSDSEDITGVWIEGVERGQVFIPKSDLRDTVRILQRLFLRHRNQGRPTVLGVLQWLADRYVAPAARSFFMDDAMNALDTIEQLGQGRTERER